MKTVMFRLFQIGFAIALLAIAFWPGWGLAYTALLIFPEHPVMTMITASIWVLLMALNLPLTRRQFQISGAACFIVIIGALIFYMVSNGLFELGDQNQLIITAIFSVGFLIGWFTISSYIWRGYRGVYGVDDADTGSD